MPTATARPLLAVNLGKNKTSAATDDSDYVQGVRTFASHADALVINVSSPNTPGLRGLQDPSALDRLLAACTTELGLTGHRPKLLLKLAPDLDIEAFRQIAQVVLNRGVDGVIVSNTTISRPKTLLHGKPCPTHQCERNHTATDRPPLAHKIEMGGLSGPDVKPLALAAVCALRAHLPESVPIIGCGGVGSGADALEFAQAGASAVQMYTAFGYDGPGAARRVKDELTALLRKEGKTWSQVVKESVTRSALKPTSTKANVAPPRSGSGEKTQTEVGKLIEEAQDIMKRLNAL
jgi:dihydroorotate dehydrogenase